jgi:large subunit ribosomal protein L22
MKATAKLKHLRTAPRKVRLVADMVRGKKAVEAQHLLAFCTKKSAKPILKLLNSAVANAKGSLINGDESNLYISKITVDEGPKLKRWRARARGQAYEIQKKTSHINLVLDEIKETGKMKKTKEKTKKPKIERVKSKDVKVEPKKIDKKKMQRQDKDYLKPKKSDGAGKKIFRRKVM